ncbi:acetyl-CoA hydrolase/transferase family protein [Effusibacillus lacus]|uniref:4-hydroxybutyrate CoA-transferase n=1 Tax=Effusibacillus lacus TaxID=1348429 RepID=A0A292YK09_9BACL|nr:acetyl-CoA hydrolase/transferase C-terminal domain-containing protein [Effusibacillus lacus]TCS72256.1 acyl-CoA hydrolase [Effusibacillus lacus]GAX90268.1 4-hydroxybutyrate CoA-transferase [Effusibacillus lacus]
MNFSHAYKDKLRSAEEAVSLINPGDDIIVPLTAGEPPALLDALPHHKGLRGNRLFQMLSLRPALSVEPERLQLVSLFLGVGDRPGFHEGRVDLLPNHFSDLPRLLRDFTKNRVIMATVSPMDDKGYFSLGTNCDYTATLLEDANLILLEVNENMPRTYGLNQIHIDQAHAIIENHVPLPTLSEPVLTDNDVKIGRTIAGLIHDGDTLQIGFGAIPNAVMNFLKDHRDLSIFTEMLPDKVADLYEAGVITNRNKPIFEGKTTMTFALGSQKLYNFMHENRDLLMIPVNQSNDIRVISQFDNIVSINATVEVDFLGQCNSETIGGKYYSSTGGQADFAKGVRLAKNGRGIICLHSTAKNGQVSKIVPTLPEGAVVTTSKNDVDIVVTEYGMAELKGKTIRERTKALIGIAHPKFREELEFAARKMGYLV